MMGDVLVWFVLLIVVILIMVGIGSEVMWWVIVWDLYNVCKLLLLWFDFFFEMVIVDLCLMVGLLMQLMFVSGFDVLLYVFESIWNVYVNFVMCGFVVQVVCELMYGFGCVNVYFDDFDVCSDMVFGVLCVGFVFLNMYIVFVYSIFYVIMLMCGVVYGIVCLFCLLVVMQVVFGVDVVCDVVLCEIFGDMVFVFVQFVVLFDVFGVVSYLVVYGIDVFEWVCIVDYVFDGVCGCNFIGICVCFLYFDFSLEQFEWVFY